MSSNQDDLSNRLRSGLNRGVAPDLSPDIVSGAPSRPTPHTSNPARAVGIAGAAGLTIAMVTVAALVLTPSLTRQPLFTAAGAPGGAAAASQLGSRDAMSSELKIGWWVDYHYTAAASLPTAGGKGQVYRLVLDNAAPEVRAQALSTALGVSGVPVKADYSDPAYPTWVVGPQDGTGASITYSSYGTGDWWYNDPAAAPPYVCDAPVASDGSSTDTTTNSATESSTGGCMGPVAIDSNTTTQPPAPAPTAANLAPTGDDARSRAQALFASTGYAVDAADIEVTSDTWGTTATAYLTLDGTRTALGWSANWSGTGALSYAAGHSVRAEVRGTFDTISAARAVERLSDNRWYGSPGPDYQGGAMMYASDVARSGAAEGVAPSSGDPGVAPTASPEQPPTETPVDPTLPPIQIDPTPQVIEVTVDNAEATLLLMWGADGNAWLVPGYAMKMQEGWWNAVVSLQDGVIALPAPIEIAPATTEVGLTK